MPIRFRDVAAETGLTFQFTPGAEPPLNILKVTTGAGVAFLDYDNDGWQDVLCVSLPRPGLFHNEGGRGFKDVTARSGLAREEARWNGCATGDYDNDGRVDLFLTACDRTALFHNNGDGTFKDVTAAAGVRLNRWATSAAFADVDQDGLLDLYVGCYVHFAPGMPEWMTIRGVHLPLSPMAYEAQKGAFFRNLGNGRFREATREAGLDATAGKTLGVLFADADNDGDDDLYLANDEEPQDFFVNDGRGHFRNLALENGTAFNGEGGRQGGMGVDFGDYDGDGHLDLFVGTFSDELKSLYHATPSGVYEQAASTAGIAQSTRPWVTFGTKFVDFDNDGRLDLMMINGHVRDLVQKVDPANSYPQKSQLFLNTGAGRFREVSDAVGPDFRKPIVGRGLAVGDFDNDGDIDALTADLQGRPQLLQNDGGNTAGNWLTVELTGKRRNRMAIGARVTLVAGGVRSRSEQPYEARYFLAKLLQKLGRTEEAIRELEQNTRENPLHQNSFYDLALYARSVGQTQRAERAMSRFRWLSSLDEQGRHLEYRVWAAPNDLQARLRLVRFYLKGQRPDLARPQVEQILRQDPSQAEARRMMQQLAAEPDPH